MRGEKKKKGTFHKMLITPSNRAKRTALFFPRLALGQEAKLGHCDRKEARRNFLLQSTHHTPLGVWKKGWKGCPCIQDCVQHRLNATPIFPPSTLQAAKLQAGNLSGSSLLRVSYMPGIKWALGSRKPTKQQT